MFYALIEQLLSTEVQFYVGVCVMAALAVAAGEYEREDRRERADAAIMGASAACVYAVAMLVVGAV